MIPDYEELNAALARVEVDYSAAESRGLLCGALAAHKAMSARDYASEILAAADPANASLGDSERMLESLFDLTRQQLSGAAPLQLMLPNDEVALCARVAALSRWCEGFLFGMAIVGIGEQTTLSADSAEMCKDIADISLAGVADQHAEEDEFVYYEIVEYLRVGVLLISEELHPAATGISAH